MDTSSEKANNDIATQPTAQEKQVPHIAAPAEQAPDEQMGWEVASRRQRGREAIEAASPNSQPARKDMRTQRHEGPLTASAASDKQKQTTPPRGSAAGQPAATQRSGQKPQQTSTKKNGKEPAAGTGAGAPPPRKVPFTASTQPTVSAWTRKANSDVEVEKANLGRQQAVPAADAAGLTSEAAKARQGKKDAVAAAHLAAQVAAAQEILMAAPEDTEEVGYVLISHTPPPSQEVNRPALRAFTLLGRIVADLERNNGSQVGGDDPPAFESEEAMMAEWTELAALHGVPPDLEGVPDERLTEILTSGTSFTSKMFFVSEASITTPLLRRLASAANLTMGASPATPNPAEEMTEVEAPRAQQEASDDENMGQEGTEKDAARPATKSTCRLSCKSNRHPYPTESMGLRVTAELESFAISEKVGIMLAPEPIGKPGGPYVLRMKEQTINVLVEEICGFYMSDPQGEERYWTIERCDSNGEKIEDPASAVKWAEEKQARDEHYRRRQDEIEDKNERTIMVVAHLPVPCCGEEWDTPACDPARAAIDACLAQISPPAEWTYKQQTSNKYGQLENQVMIFITFNEEDDSWRHRDHSHLKYLLSLWNTPYGYEKHTIYTYMPKRSLNTLKVKQCCFRPADVCQAEHPRACTLKSAKLIEFQIPLRSRPTDSGDNRPYHSSAQERKRMRDSEEETKRKALHNDVTKVFDDTRGLCSLFLQGKVTDPDTVREPHTPPPTLIPARTESVCQEIHGNQVQGGAPRSDILQGEPGDNMYLSQAGPLLLASGPVSLQGPSTDNPLCTTCSIGEQHLDSTEGPQGRQGEPQPSGSSQTEGHRHGRPLGVDATAPLTVPVPSMRQLSGLDVSSERYERQRGDDDGSGVHPSPMHPQVQTREIQGSADPQTSAITGGGAHSLFRPIVAAGRSASETGRAAGGESHQAGSGEHMGSGARMGTGKARATHVDAEHTAVCRESSTGQCFMPKCSKCTRHLTRCVFCDQQWIPYHLACSCDTPDCTSYEACCSAILMPTELPLENPCAARRNRKCVFPQCQICSLLDLYCIHCGRARGDYNSCKCMPEISQRNRAVVPAPPPPPESVPCTCRLSWGGGCRALVEVPAAASAGRRSRALCQICTHHIGSETCGCRCGRCYRHDMNYQADSDECDAIEADATRRELYGWIDNVDDCMQEGLWQVDRQRASNPASSMEARCPQTTDGKHRLYRCETCGLFSAFCGHCKRQKLPLDGSTCSCVWPAASLPAEHTLMSTTNTGGAPVRSSMGLTVAACTQLTSRKVYGVAQSRLGVDCITWYSASAFTTADLEAFNDLPEITPEEAAQLAPPPPDGPPLPAENRECPSSRNGRHRSLFCGRCNSYHALCNYCGIQIAPRHESCTCLVSRPVQLIHRYWHTGNILFLNHRLPWNTTGSGGSP